MDRRKFLTTAAAAAAGAGFARTASADVKKAPALAAEKGTFTISLAEWSCHKMIFGKKLDHLDFSKFTKEECGIDAVEYVNQFFKDKADDKAYIAELDKRAKDLGVTQVLIMIDGEGSLGDPDEKKRDQAIKNHHKWVRAAKALGCHSIRVNAHSHGSREEQEKLAADGLSRLTEYGDEMGINIIVENHGGLSSDGSWLSAVMKRVNKPRCGTLPDFGNFRLDKEHEYDRYKGTEELMPFAKGVSAKSYDFNEAGDETTIDFPRMMKIVAAAGYHGRVGIEYEGGRLGEKEGILATKKLLERIRAEQAKG
ncbi:MAG TPA: sugar phosphate isomerase/epimerase family protein [Planctomycetia bacterium]|nr:sugar phosphate isomerase/epimerase family protein [Planctomycetia bacterium]